MKQKFKTIISIATTINGHTEYISGQSVRDFDGRYLPQFNQRTVHAKEFVDEEDAYNYLSNVVNNYNRHYSVVTLEIPDLNYEELKKYDRKYKKQQLTGHHYHGGIKDGARLRGLLI